MTARACLRREAASVRVRWFVELRRASDEGGCVVLVGMLGGGTVCESVVVEQLFTDDGGESAMSSTANVARTDIARGSMAGLSQNATEIYLLILTDFH